MPPVIAVDKKKAQCLWKEDALLGTCLLDYFELVGIKRSRKGKKDMIPHDNWRQQFLTLLHGGGEEQDFVFGY